MRSEPFAIKRSAIAEPETEPALSPTVYAEFFVHFTVSVVVWSTLPPSGSTAPNARSAAVTLHCALTFADAWNDVLVEPAYVDAVTPSAMMPATVDANRM